MNTYRLGVFVTVEVEAFDLADALEAVQDTFGLGETGSLNVKGFQVTDVTEL